MDITSKLYKWKTKNTYSEADRIDERKKILYIGYKRHLHGHAKGFYWDLFLELMKEELSRQHDVLFWGWGYRYNWVKKRHLSDVIDFFGTPDIVLADSLDSYRNIGLPDIDAIKAHIVGDCYHGMSKGGRFHRHIGLLDQYDVFLAKYYSSVLLFEEHFPEKKCYFWGGSVDTNFFRNYRRDRFVDVFFGASAVKSLYGPDRQLIQVMLGEMRDEGFKTENKRNYFYGHYVDILNASKIAISQNKYGFTPNRVYEVMACGPLLLTDRYIEFDIIGFKDGEHMVIYDDLDDLRDKIYYYLKNDSERESIALKGYELVSSKFSTREAVQRMVGLIEKGRG